MLPTFVTRQLISFLFLQDLTNAGDVEIGAILISILKWIFSKIENFICITTSGHLTLMLLSFDM